MPPKQKKGYTPLVTPLRHSTPTGTLTMDQFMQAAVACCDTRRAQKNGHKMAAELIEIAARSANMTPQKFRSVLMKLLQHNTHSPKVGYTHEERCEYNRAYWQQHRSEILHRRREKREQERNARIKK